MNHDEKSFDVLVRESSDEKQLVQNLQQRPDKFTIVLHFILASILTQFLSIFEALVAEKILLKE